MSRAVNRANEEVTLSVTRQTVEQLFGAGQYSPAGELSASVALNALADAEATLRILSTVQGVMASKGVLEEVDDLDHLLWFASTRMAAATSLYKALREAEQQAPIAEAAE